MRLAGYDVAGLLGQRQKLTDLIQTFRLSVPELFLRRRNTQYLTSAAYVGAFCWNDCAVLRCGQQNAFIEFLIIIIDRVDIYDTGY